MSSIKCWRGDGGGAALEQVVEGLAKNEKFRDLHFTVDAQSSYGLPRIPGGHEGSNSSQGVAHDAGYDSLLTAVLFCMQTRHMEVSGRNISAHANKLKLTRTAPNSINLTGRDRGPVEREYAQCFSVSGLPGNIDDWTLTRTFAPACVEATIEGNGVATIRARTEDDAATVQRIYALLKPTWTLQTTE